MAKFEEKLLKNIGNSRNERITEKVDMSSVLHNFQLRANFFQRRRKCWQSMEHPAKIAKTCGFSDPI
jgi:hypothetical protein